MILFSDDLPQLQRVRLDPISIGTAVDTWWQDQHTPAPRLLHRGAEAEVGGAAIIERLGEEFGGRRRTHFGARLHHDALCQRKGMTVSIQVTGVLLQQSQKCVELFVSPAAQLGRLLQLAFHFDPASASPGGQRAAEPIGEREVEAK